MCLDWLKKYFKNENYTLKTEYADNMEYTRITSSDTLRKMMDVMGTPPQYILLDRYFWTVNIAHVVWFLDNDDTNKFKYISDDGITPAYDCDAFSIRLWGNFKIPGWSNIPLGVIIIQPATGGLHMMNIFVDDDMEIWAIEPQNNCMYTMVSLIENGWRPVLIMM